MCTVTVIPAPRREAAHTGLWARLMCNRDEQRTRAPSTSPVIVRANGRRAIMPIDPSSGGTWIGANDIGLVACLLNANSPRHGPTESFAGRRSRGSIVPTLLASGSLLEAADLANGINPDDYPPFRMLLLAPSSYLTIHSCGRRLAINRPAPLSVPFVLTSSSLGDARVQALRSRLFHRTLAVESDVLRAQTRFHSHHWPGRPHLSVLMSRPDARTVSRTFIDLREEGTELSHVQLDDALRPIGRPSRASVSMARPVAA